MARSSMTMILPMCKVRYVRSYPHGDKDAQRFGPDHPYQIKHVFDITQMGFSNRFESTYSENPSNIQRFFAWAKNELHDHVANMMYDKEGVASSVKTKMRQGVPANKKDDGAFVRTQFSSTYVKPVVTIDNAGVSHVKLSAQLLHGVFDSEVAGFAKNPYVAPTKFLHDVYYTPDRIKVVAGKEAKASDSGKPAPTHYKPHVMNDLPMLRGRTHREWAELRKTIGADIDVDPFVLVPQSERCVQDGDLIFPVAEIDLFNSNATGDKTGMGGLKVVALIWVGEAYCLDESIEALPADADLSQFFVMSQKYTRRGVPDHEKRADMEPHKSPALDHMMSRASAGNGAEGAQGNDGGNE
jgi:hypothetical protein